MAMPSCEESSPSTWRFTMELLSHVHALRVFLLPCSSQVQPARDCVNVEATLLSAPPALSCSWKIAHEALPRSIRLPLPVLLFDYSSSPRIAALTDCIQLSLYLLPLPPPHLHALSSLSLSASGPSDSSEAAHAAIHGECAVPKGIQCEDDDDSYQSHEKNGTLQSMACSTSAENSISCDSYTGQSLEHECTHNVMLPANGGIDGDVICKVEGTYVTQEAASRVHADNDGCNSSTNNVNKNHVNNGLYDDGTQSVECGGALHEILHNAIPTLNNHACNNIEMSRVDICEDVCKVCLSAIHVQEGSGCNPERCVLRHSLFSQYCKEEIKANRHPTHYNGGAVEASVLCQHVHAANNGSSLHSQSYELARHNVSIHQGFEDDLSQGTAIFVCKKCLAKVSRKPVRSFVQLPCFDWREVVENWFGACCCSFGSTAEFLSVGFERSLQLRPGKCLVGPSTFYVYFSDVVVIAEPGLLSNERDMRQSSTLHFLSLGDGFMVWENQQSKAFDWLPLCCANCASLIGAYPCTSSDSGSTREGVHLFRCQVITYNTDGTLYNAYRYKSFKDLLVKELRQRTDENTSYRFLIRSLRLELPLLQLVVINYDSLTCTGRVHAGVAEHSQCFSRIEGLHRGVGLQQSLKVLFLDCTRLSGEDVRPAELWVKEHDAETVFMLEEFVDKLRDELVANSMFCPTECGLFQSFKGSFLYTTQE